MLDLWVKRALIVAQPGLDRATVVIDDRLWLIGLQRIERRRCHDRRGDFLEVDGGRHVGVDGAGVDADHMGALAPQLDPCGVREAPCRSLGCRVGRDQRRRDPRADGQDVDECASAVAFQHRRERLRHRDQTEIVGLKFHSSDVEGGAQRDADVEDSGVVDDHLYVVEFARDRRDSVGVRNVELDRHDAGVGDGAHVAHRGVHLLRAAVQQRLRERLADPAVGARDEDRAALDAHGCLLVGSCAGNLAICSLVWLTAGLQVHAASGAGCGLTLGWLTSAAGGAGWAGCRTAASVGPPRATPAATMQPALKPPKNACEVAWWRLAARLEWPVDARRPATASAAPAESWAARARCAGRADGSAAVSRLADMEAYTLPLIATPSVLPSRRGGALTADPTPALAGGATPTLALGR